MRLPSHAQRTPRLTLCVLALVAACTTVAGTATCGGQAASAGPARSFDSARAWKLLAEQVAIGPRPAGSAGAEATRALIERELTAAGLRPVREAFTAQTPAGAIQMANVWAEVPAARDPARASVIAIGSHFDTERMDVPFVGANDGASSTAVLLELARALAAQPSQHTTYRLVFFDGEESVRDFWEDPDNRYGSRHHVERLQADGQFARLRYFVLVDLVGDKDLVLTRDENSGRQLFEAFLDGARSVGLERHMAGPRLPIKDDHLSFLSGGVESIDLIDFEYGPHNAWWHSPEDTLDKCSQASLDAIGRIVLAGLPRVEALR